MKQVVNSEFPQQVAEVLSVGVEGNIPTGSVHAQLENILTSGIIARSERLKRFLLLTVDEVLQGRGRQLNEYLIGVEVFDRQENHDPRIDPIVRVETRLGRSNCAD